ncbi:hypothetical protein ACFOW1_04965 [Parasediminibacterium paludis]|uniref:Carboxypeptidase-like protein n=1 Tax=Parasediminibacterium paludis TaxID=908966 RepID=A0ABV8PUH3_9BACT
MKKGLYLLIFICVAYTSEAQQKNSIIGVVKDSVTNTIIEFASISNINKKNTIVSNTKGMFKIDIALNHLLSVAAVGYNFDTIRVTEDLLQLDTLTILLHPLSKRLADVTVTTKTKYNQYQLDSIERRRDFFINRSDVKIPVVSLANSGVGLGINLDHFYNRERRKRSAMDLFNDMENESYTNYRFTPAIINKYTKLEGEKLVTFMQLYRPSYAWLRSHTTEEDVLYYINDKLKSFNKRQKK